MVARRGEVGTATIVDSLRAHRTPGSVFGDFAIFEPIHTTLIIRLARHRKAAATSARPGNTGKFAWVDAYFFDKTYARSTVLSRFLSRPRDAAVHEDFQIPDSLLARCGGNPQLAEKVIGIFINQLNDDIPNLERLMQQRLARESAKIAHRIKGASANSGAEELCELAAKIEEHAAASEFVDAECRLSELKSQWREYVERAETVLS